ncbi:MAG: TatD family hydrolase, partial [Bacteroidia bacterium]|nr:TatD family hydrolase [Bacteroidia bacterium]
DYLKTILPYINIHSHSSGTDGHITITNTHQFFERIIDSKIYSIGLHPWYLTADTMNEDLCSLERYAALKNVIAIGECGLDKLCQTGWELQKKAFIQQIQIAEKLKKPMIIHCVKAFNELIETKKELKVKTPMIVHGYNNNKHIAEQLLQHGFYFSFGKALLKAGSNASALIGILPKERIFLETDDADISIKTIFDAAANHLQMNEDELKVTIYNNFKTVFQYERP